MKAISIRQPWACLIANGHKDIENRTWQARVRGPVLIHASNTMTRDDLESAVITADRADEDGTSMLRIEVMKWNPYPNWSLSGCPFERGGIVGIACITDCVQKSKSPWFSGPNGFVLTNAAPLPFTPLQGALGFFNVDLRPFPELMDALEKLNWGLNGPKA